jgi:hypothetical protein
MNKWIYRGLGTMVAGFSVPSAYAVGSAFAPAGSVLGIATGTAGVGVVGAGVALLPCATKCFGRREWFRGLLLSAAWAVAFSAVLYGSIGNVSAIRGDTVAEKSDAIGRYERANADLARLNADREAAKKTRSGKPVRTAIRSTASRGLSAIVSLALGARSMPTQRSSTLAIPALPIRNQ